MRVITIRAIVGIVAVALKQKLKKKVSTMKVLHQLKNKRKGIVMCGMMAVALVTNMVMPAVTYAAETGVAEEVAIEDMSKKELVEALYLLVMDVEGNSDYIKYNDFYETMNKADLTRDELLQAVGKIAPGVNLSGITEANVIAFLLTLPKFTEWLHVKDFMLDLENDLGDDITLVSLDKLEWGDLEWYYKSLSMAVKGTTRESGAVDLFKLVSRIYVWPSFGEFVKNERAVAAINQVNYFMQSTETVLKQEMVPGMDKSIWEMINADDLKNAPAFSGITALIHNYLWLGDEESTKVKNALEVLSQESLNADNDMHDLVDWRSLGVNDVTALTKEQALAKAMTWPIYLKYKDLEQVLQGLLCAGAIEHTLDDADDSGEEVNCCIKPWWDMRISPQALDEEIRSVMPVDFVHRVMHSGEFNNMMPAKIEFVRCMDGACNNEETTCDENGACATFDKVKTAAIKIDAHVADGLVACAEEEAEAPKAPDAGDLMRKANGELTDLGNAVLILSVSVAVVLGLMVIARLYTRRKL